MPDVVLILLFFPLALFLPGYLVVSCFANRGAGERNLEAIEATFLSVVLSSALTGTIALALAQVGHFGLPVLLVILLLVCVGAAGLLWFKHRALSWQITPSHKTEWLALFSVVVGAGALFLHPHQYVFGAGDAGVYVNLGANLDQTGALLIREPLLAEIAPDLLPGLLRELLPGATTRFIHLPGFYVSDSEPGLVIPQFYALHPVWLGIGHSLFGVSGALMVTPIWGVLGVVALYLCGRALFNWWTGWLAAVLLLLTPLQIYFARYPTAEPLTQFYTWVFLLAFTMFTLDRQPRGLWGLVAGVAFGQVFLARIDALPMLLVPAAWMLVLLWRRRWPKDEGWFWIPLLGLTGYALFHGLAFSRPYTLDLYGWVIPLVWKRFWFVAVAGVIGAGVFFSLQRRWHSSHLGIQRLSWGPILRYAAAAALVSVAIYAYFIRPRIGQTALASYWYSGSQVLITNHENLVRLGWYLSPLGIGLAVAGGVLFLLNEAWAKLWPLWGIGGGFSAIYVYNIFNNPYHIYAMRRYVPVVVPFFVLAGACALAWLWRRETRKRTARLIGVTLLLTLVGWLAYNDRLVWKQIDYEGAVQQVERLAGFFEDRSIVLFVDDAPVGLGC
jgi:hypothetical protein